MSRQRKPMLLTDAIIVSHGIANQNEEPQKTLPARRYRVSCAA